MANMLKKNLKKILIKIPSFFIILAGIILLIYPWISNYLYENRSDGIIETYQNELDNTEQDEKDKILAIARAYNQQIYEVPVRLTDPFSMEEVDKTIGIDYDSILKINDTGMMGTINIPKISITLPIYHGTSNEVLENGIGHLQGTSFPIGGENTHSVLTGHTGLNYAKMFTDLTSLEEGDYFFITVLNEKMAYQVNKIEVVLPSEVDSLYIEEGKDLVTLITCTPYGINDHRLFVTGERTEYTEEIYEEELEIKTTDTMWLRSYMNAIVIGLISTPFIILMVVLYRRKLIRIIRRF